MLLDAVLQSTNCSGRPTSLIEGTNHSSELSFLQIINILVGLGLELKMVKVRVSVDRVRDGFGYGYG